MVVLIPTVASLLGAEEVPYEVTFTALSMTNRLAEAESLWSEIQKQVMLGTTFSFTSDSKVQKKLLFPYAMQ